MFNWNSADFDAPDMDVSSKFGGAFVDIVKCSDGTWTVFFDGERIGDGFRTKDNADDFLVNHVLYEQKPQHVLAKKITVTQPRVLVAA